MGDPLAFLLPPGERLGHMTVLISRANWGGNSTHFQPRSAEEIVRAVVHTEAGAKLTDHDKCDDRCRSIDQYHRSKGWTGSGYHRMICPHGSVYESRPLLTVGAHEEKANRNGVGYCFLGVPDAITDAAKTAFLRVLRSDEARVGRALRIQTHAEVAGDTECPGPVLSKWVKELRAGKATVPAETRRVHEVRKGETLWGIAVDYYRDGGKWQKIAAANRISDPDVIQPGQKLVIP